LLNTHWCARGHGPVHAPHHWLWCAQR
jgi:hypothetical protein